MNDVQVLAGEAVIATAINSWGALKNGDVPWAGTVVRTSIAFGIIGLVGIPAPQLGKWLGAGLLLAAVIAVAQEQGSGGKWSNAFGAVSPTDGTYQYLSFGKSA